jgi:hypothetical protein
MPSYPPIRVRVTLQINLPPIIRMRIRKNFMPSYPPIRVRVTLRINLPLLSEGEQEKFLCGINPYPSECNFKN